MNTVEKLESGQEQIQAAWFRGDKTGQPLMAVYADGRTTGDDVPCDCLATSVHHDQEACDFIRRAIGLPTGSNDFSDIWQFNDSLPADATGRARAIAVMEKAIELAKAAA